MYFIRTGQFVVEIKSKFTENRNVVEEEPCFKTQLYDGDHFGEIGLIFECKRTGTVKSLNYGSLARLTEKGFKSLAQEFENFTSAFKNYVFKYKDDLRTFLEMECDKIKYFKDLDVKTKQELLFNMERKTYQQGQHIFQKGDEVDRLTVIQSGIVELSVPYDNRLRDEEFVIERLISGAILNHQAFILKQKTWADYVCRTPVSCFELTYERMKKVEAKRPDL